MRVFLDTNVLFSAIAAQKGVCAKLFVFILEEDKFSILTSAIVIQELEEALAKKAGLHRGNEKIDLFFAELYKHEIVPTPEIPLHPDTLDSNDALILAAAVKANADFLITGDAKLAGMKVVGNTRVITPRYFCDQFVPK